jgi:mono/diheme cytochrome c family protein
MNEIMKRIIGSLIMLAAAGFLLIQLVPYGRSHNNPPVLQEPAWDQPQTRLLAKRACFDCHSNETFWPWYSNLAPMSWLVQRDVDEGRSRLNFSEWGLGEQEVDDAGETIREGEMPPLYYVLLHPQAKLSTQERDALISGLAGSLGASGVDNENE